MKPILFNTDMVRAIQNGTKTATRRVVKPQPPATAHVAKIRCSWCWSWWEDSDSHEMKPPCRPGDILYARETFKIDYLSNIPGSGRIHYKADDTYSDFTFAPERYEMMRRAQLKPGWRPNENMPREAARIFLLVKDVRVERLRGITDGGLMRDFGFCMDAINAVGRDALAGPFWDSTIKPADRARYGWEANPWVWVIEFERCERPEGVLK